MIFDNPSEDPAYVRKFSGPTGEGRNSVSRSIDHRTEAGDGLAATNDPAPSGSATTFPYLSDDPAARRITDAKRSGFDVAVGVVREALALGIDHTGKCDAWSDMNESDCTCGRGNLQALAEIPRGTGNA